MAYENNEYNDVFVASASGRGDSTSQWYRYGDKGRGYAIGFRADAPLAIRTPIPPMDEFALEISVGDFSIVDTWQRVVYGSEKELPELFNALVASTTSIRDKHVEERTRLLADAGPEEGAQRAAHAQANFEVMLANLEIAAELNKLFRLLKGDPWREEQEVRSVAVLRDGGALMKYKPARVETPPPTSNSSHETLEANGISATSRKPASGSAPHRGGCRGAANGGPGRPVRRAVPGGARVPRCRSAAVESAMR